MGYQNSVGKNEITAVIDIRSWRSVTEFTDWMGSIDNLDFLSIAMESYKDYVRLTIVIVTSLSVCQLTNVMAVFVREHLPNELSDIYIEKA